MFRRRCTTFDMDIRKVILKNLFKNCYLLNSRERKSRKIFLCPLSTHFDEDDTSISLNKVWTLLLLSRWRHGLLFSLICADVGCLQLRFRVWGSYWVWFWISNLLLPVIKI